MNKKNRTQTPDETRQALAALAEKLEEMDRAEGDFGEAMVKALPDVFLDEVAGGMPHIVITTQGDTKYQKQCIRCTHWFTTYNSAQEKCENCLKLSERT